MTRARRVAAVLLAMYIVTGPAFQQLGLWPELPVRTWQMYSTVGLWAPYGEFEVIERDSGRVVETVSITHAMGLDAIRDLQPYPGSGSINRDFRSLDEFRAVAAPLCDALASGEALRFEGRMAVPDRWYAFFVPEEDLC